MKIYWEHENHETWLTVKGQYSVRLIEAEIDPDIMQLTIKDPQHGDTLFLTTDPKVVSFVLENSEVIKEKNPYVWIASTKFFHQ